MPSFELNFRWAIRARSGSKARCSVMSDPVQNSGTAPYRKISTLPAII